MARNKTTLLTESELRKFMKLANLGAVGQERLNEFGYSELEEEEADPEALEDYAAGDLERGEPGEAMADEEEADLEMGAMDDMDAPADDMGPDAGGAGMVSVDDFMSALENALEDVLGEPVSTEMDDEPADDMGDEMDDDIGPEMEMDIEAGPDDMEVTASEEEEELPGMRDMYENQDELVQEVARRVAARLQAESDKSQMVEELSQKILDRLTAK